MKNKFFVILFLMSGAPLSSARAACPALAPYPLQDKNFVLNKSYSVESTQVKSADFVRKEITKTLLDTKSPIAELVLNASTSLPGKYWMSSESANVFYVGHIETREDSLSTASTETIFGVVLNASCRESSSQGNVSQQPYVFLKAKLQVDSAGSSLEVWQVEDASELFRL